MTFLVIAQLDVWKLMEADNSVEYVCVQCVCVYIVRIVSQSEEEREILFEIGSSFEFVREQIPFFSPSFSFSFVLRWQI